MALEWNGDAAIRAMREEIARRLLAAASTLVTEHKTKLNISNPYTRGPRGGRVYTNPAAKGDWPHKRTGNLQRNVIYEPRSPSEVARTLRVRVGLMPPAFYGASLADRGWKGLLDTLATCKDRLQAIIGQGGDVTGTR